LLINSGNQPHVGKNSLFSGSNRTPLLINSGNQPHVGKNRLFSFELSMLRHDGFQEMVAVKWDAGRHGDTPIEH
jgi:hypothetical protein